MKKSLLFIFSFLVISATMYAQWTAQTSGVTVRLRQLSVVNDNIVWCGGNDGTVLLTTDGGATWVKKTAPSATWAIYDIYAIDATTVYVTGMDQNDANAVNTKIWKSIDGGSSWVEQYNNVLGFGDGLVMFDANNGVWWGDPDPYPSSAWEILTTTNGGTNWTRVPRANYPGADSANGEYGAAGAICKFGNHVWFTGYTAVTGTPNYIYHSTDRGLHWTSAPLNKVSGTSGSGYLAFHSETHGVFMGLDGTRAYTRDGGATWTVATDKTPALRFVTSVPGTDAYIAVGSSGASLISKDDGVTWTALTGIPAQNMYGVEASANAAWACGNAGTIVKLSGAENLPVELKSFTAKMDDGKVNLEWITVTETNNKGFEVERKSADGQWSKIAFVEGNGTTTSASKYSYNDDITNLSAQVLSYRLKQIDYEGTYTYSSEVKVDNLTPSKFEISQNYPNPFNPSTMIKYGLPVESNVSITVYNSIGQLVEELVSNVQQAGYYEIPFNATNLTTGTYFYSIKAQPVNGEEGFNTVKKMLLVK
jgi:photosystem II stability/assembly factor-like uncharacterized protein